MQFICKSASLLGMSDFCPEMYENALTPAFISHMNRFGLTYGTQEEFDFRFQLFQKKDAVIQKINSDADNTFRVGHNKFSTWTDAEYRRLLGAKVSSQELEAVELDETGIPTSVDWTKLGAVNKVKDQGQCGSCWAFSVTASLEGMAAIKTKKLLDLSEQQLVDCDTTSYGCEGGYPYNALSYYQKDRADLQKDYAYEAADGACKSARAPGQVGVAKVAVVKA